MNKLLYRIKKKTIFKSNQLKNSQHEYLHVLHENKMINFDNIINKVDMTIEKEENSQENIDNDEEGDEEEDNLEYNMKRDNHGPMSAYFTYIKKLMISYASYLSSSIDIDHLNEYSLEMATEAVQIARKIHQVYEKFII